MPYPPIQDRQISKPLENFTLAAMQNRNNFIAERGAPIIEVPQQVGKYFTYPTGGWNILEMGERASSSLADQAGWTQSNDSFSCDRFAVAHLEDWNDLAGEDTALQSDKAAADWLANQALMKWDSLFAAAVLQAATWTTDYDGVSSNPTAGSEVLQWNDSSSVPQKDALIMGKAVRKLTGFYPNVMIVGEDVDLQVRTHSEVRAALQYTMQTKLENITESMLAGYFGVEQYIVATSVYNSAAEGATASMAQYNAKDAWFGYVNPNPGKRAMTAAATFAFNGMGGSRGLVARKYDREELTATAREIELFVDVKVIAADAGAFIDDCVA